MQNIIAVNAANNNIANMIADSASDVAMTDAESLAFRFGVTSGEVIGFLDDSVEEIAIWLLSNGSVPFVINPVHDTIVSERMVNAGASPLLHQPGWVTMSVIRDDSDLSIEFVSDHDRAAIPLPDQILKRATKRYVDLYEKLDQIVDDLNMTFEVEAAVTGRINGAHVTVAWRHCTPVLQFHHVDEFHVFNPFLNEIVDKLPAGFDVVLYRDYVTDWR